VTPTDGLVEFTAIVEAGSIRGGARALGMSRATAARHLDALERRLGVRLLHRTTRSLSLTRAGDELFRRARQIVHDVQAAAEAVRALDDHPRGRLRVSVPPHTAPLTDMLLAFATTWPDVQLEIDASSAHVDLRADQIDVAIRAGTVRDPELVCRTLERTETVAVARRDYLDRHGVPEHVDDLTAHQLLLGYEAGHVPQRSWPLLDGGTVPVSGRFASNDVFLLGRAAARGLGIALAPLAVVRSLFPHDAPPVHVLPGIVGRRTQVTLVWPEREFLQPQVRAFIDHVVAHHAAGGLLP